MHICIASVWPLVNIELGATFLIGAARSSIFHNRCKAAQNTYLADYRCCYRNNVWGAASYGDILDKFIVDPLLIYVSVGFTALKGLCHEIS